MPANVPAFLIRPSEKLASWAASARGKHAPRHVVSVGSYRDFLANRDNARLDSNRQRISAELRGERRGILRAPEVAHQHARTLSGDLYIRDWTQQNKTWFVAERLQKRMPFLILKLIVSVAAFKLVSSLVTTVTKKQADIAIPRTLDAQPGSIMKIFVVQGMTIGLVGTTSGMLVSCAIALSIPWVLPAVEYLLGIQFLTPPVYFLSELPSKLIATDVIEIGVTAFPMFVTRDALTDLAHFKGSPGGSTAL
jgi:hypothetical protein